MAHGHSGRQPHIQRVRHTPVAQRSVCVRDLQALELFRSWFSRPAPRPCARGALWVRARRIRRGARRGRRQRSMEPVCKRIRSLPGGTSSIAFWNITFFTGPSVPGGGTPVPCGKPDFDGDGRADISVYRDGNWFIKLSSNDVSVGTGLGRTAGHTGACSYDGDGLTDIAVYRSSDVGWYILRSSDGVLTITGFGLPTDIPVPADYDGDGRADIAVYRDDGSWYILRSSDGGITALSTGGLPQDIPIKLNWAHSAWQSDGPALWNYFDRSPGLILRSLLRCELAQDGLSVSETHRSRWWVSARCVSTHPTSSVLEKSEALIPRCLWGLLSFLRTSI